MNPKLPKVIIPSALAFLLIACAGGSPVKNVDNAPINASSPDYDLSDVSKAIRRAGIGTGWKMKERAPGNIVGALSWRSHLAVIAITFTLDEYSISYEDSTNLRYEGHSIHRNYNSRIEKLNDAINEQLMAL